MPSRSLQVDPLRNAVLLVQHGEKAEVRELLQGGQRIGEYVGMAPLGADEPAVEGRERRRFVVDVVHLLESPGCCGWLPAA